MNIMILEDRGSVTYYMKQKLAGLGHVILEAYNVNDAESHWRRRDSTTIDCMIVDLNMPTEGLSKEQKRRAKGGLFTGWIWLTERVFAEDRSMRQRVVIYTDYLSDLEAHASKEELAGIRLVAKKGSTSPADQVVRHLSDIRRELQERSR